MIEIDSTKKISRSITALNSIGLEFPVPPESAFPLILDSIDYISAIVVLEDEFMIQFPDDLLSDNIFESPEKLCCIILGLITS